MAAPDQSQRPSWNHIDTGHSTPFETASKASWAILVTGVNAEIARGWREKAASTDFPSDWGTLANWTNDDFNLWCKKMAPELKTPQTDLAGKFRLKWCSIWDLARYLDQFASEGDFRDRFFDGKTQGRDLREMHVKRLAKIKGKSGRLSMIGPANRYFISCLSMKLSKAAETQRMSHRGFQSLCHIRVRTVQLPPTSL